jgi:zinc/manganese transport system substrate-binding protein
MVQNRLGRFRRLTAALVLFVLMSGVSLVGAQDEPLKVIATYSILGDIVQNIAGDNIELTVLVGPDGDSHVYEPTPQDAIALAEADVIFENGLEFETWLDDLYESSGSTATRIVVSDGIEPLALEEHDDEHEGEEAHEDEHEHEEEAHEEEDHEHGEFDPHVWHDPNNSIVMVESIRDALAAADPTNTVAYEANAEAYITELEAVDDYIREQVATIPEANRILVTSHDTFGYFADAYGFEVMPVLASLSTEAADPSAGEIAELVTEIEASSVPAIFTENISNPALVEQVASEAGVIVAPALYTDALGQPGTPGETFLGMLRYNIDTITEALQ